MLPGEAVKREEALCEESTTACQVGMHMKQLGNSSLVQDIQLNAKLWKPMFVPSSSGFYSRQRVDKIVLVLWGKLQDTFKSTNDMHYYPRVRQAVYRMSVHGQLMLLENGRT